MINLMENFLKFIILKFQNDIDFEYLVQKFRKNNKKYMKVMNSFIFSLIIKKYIKLI